MRVRRDLEALLDTPEAFFEFGNEDAVADR